MFGYRHAADDLLHARDLVGVDHRADLHLVLAGAAPDDLQLLFLTGVAHEHLHHKPVELGLGERVGALLLQRILRREHEEGRGQGVAGAADGDLPFLHGFQERRLGLGRCPVDFVGQHDIGEDRASHEAKRAVTRGLVLLDDLGAGDIAGHEVGGELDA